MQYKKGQKNKTRRRSKTQLTKGAYGKPIFYFNEQNEIIGSGVNKSIVNFNQNLRVLPKLKRTKENSNFCGVQND
jgi:hypothetical protein